MAAYSLSHGSNSHCITYLFLFFTGRTNIQKLKMRTSTRATCGAPLGTNDKTSMGRLKHVLNSTHKHIKLTLTGHSRLYSEWY